MENLLVVFLLDLSDSMEEWQPELFSAIHGKMGHCCMMMDNGTEMEIIFRSFSSSLHRKPVPESALSGLTFESMTALFDTVIRMLHLLHAAKRPSVLLVFTDGHDNLSDSSLEDLVKEIRLALENGNILIEFPLASFRDIARVQQAHRPHISVLMTKLSPSLQQWINNGDPDASQGRFTVR